MAAILLTHPAKAAENVCHDEQLQIWAHEVFCRLATEDYIRDLDYGEQVEVEIILREEIKKIIGMAFTHPEAMRSNKEGGKP